MQRYFIEEGNWHGDQLVITGDDFHHIVNVMRMDAGEEILCNHPNGNVAHCTILNVEDGQVTAEVAEWLDSKTESPISVTIAQGLPKGDKWEFILQKSTELGASRIITYQAERSVVKWDAKKVNKKIGRWEKIVKEASEQAHRNQIPSVDGVLSFSALLEESQTYDWKFFAYEEEARDQKSNKLHDYFSQIREGDRVFFCIGPEGGFSEKEAGQLKAASFHPVRLGPRILRTETAPLYVLSSLSYYFEEMR
ncbi:16S rRNA (uracil1498-N3)-methyltransferase [Gracilibacillus ureilyticus]|uniref:Ribosomal RNA small subunit methyltransferase E n=1 Tax=Gracilibacillus ureilyticus TaxID=531814 RepID=A0A1H9M3P7_9BACI|nr:16S rRNA (uracil(1498)-N(3))-methyltransferase [Gracilibacillus ureilyticus]SER18139.1 16S rRNA (uracil1498-N3)-methyltransferase [Gracilibacillus ureilyticus]